MTLTRAKVLKSSLTFSLRRVKVQLGRRFYDLGLTPGMVEEIANTVIADLRKHGNWPELDDEAGPSPTGTGRQVPTNEAPGDILAIGYATLRGVRFFVLGFCLFQPRCMFGNLLPSLRHFAKDVSLFDGRC